MPPPNAPATPTSSAPAVATAPAFGASPASISSGATNMSAAAMKAMACSVRGVGGLRHATAAAIKNVRPYVRLLRMVMMPLSDCA